MLTIIFGKANNSKPTIKRLCAKSHRNDKDYYYHSGNFYDNVMSFGVELIVQNLKVRNLLK